MRFAVNQTDVRFLNCQRTKINIDKSIHTKIDQQTNGHIARPLLGTVWPLVNCLKQFHNRSEKRSMRLDRLFRIFRE